MPLLDSAPEAVTVGESTAPTRDLFSEESFDILNLLIPVVFGILLWVSVGMLYPQNGLLSLMLIGPAMALLLVRVVSKTVSNMITWDQFGSWVGIGIFLEVVLLSLQLVILFSLSVFGYGVVFSGYWDSKIHGFGDVWQSGDMFTLVNVSMSIIGAFFVFAIPTEAAKYFICKSIPAAEPILTLPRYLSLSVVSFMGLAWMEALVFILISGGLRYSLYQVFLCLPLHLLTGTGIAISTGNSPHRSMAKTIFAPVLVQGFQHFLAYMLELFASEVFVIQTSLYVGLTLFLSSVYGFSVYRHFKSLNPRMLVIGEDADLETIEMEFRQRVAGEVHSSDLCELAAAA